MCTRRLRALYPRVTPTKSRCRRTSHICSCDMCTGVFVHLCACVPVYLCTYPRPNCANGLQIDKEAKIIKLDEMIAQLKDQLQETKARVSDEGKYVKKEADVQVSHFENWS